MGSVVEINPLTRVEGHGTVRVFLEGERVERVEFALTESPRLFEALLVGRSYQEVPEIICRICSLCSTVHKVTALLAVERAFGVEVSEVTRLTRELILNGGQLQSHTLHLYCLLLPDLVGEEGMAGLARRDPGLLKEGLAIKRVGNLIQETVGGRLIHPVNIALGGLGRRVPRDALERLGGEIDAVLPLCAGAWQRFRPVPEPTPLHAPAYLALREEGTPFTGDRFRMAGGRSFPVESYRDGIVEELNPCSHAKDARALGEPPCVGSLARLNLGATLEAQAQALFDTVRGEIEGKDMRANALAQAVELYQAALRARHLVGQLLELEGAREGNVDVAPREGAGSTACEAPRGTLIHSYRFDAAGVCQGADVITPTSLNQLALARDLDCLAQALGGSDTAFLAGSLEHLVRCYDPCISCAVHLVDCRKGG